MEPVEDSSSASRKRQHFKKPRDRETELKRERGEISCAECRRLKLKCNKKVPCSSCLRRGCHTICPNGSLATGQGTRFVLAKTDKLHDKLHEMSHRIRQLEDALKILNTYHSSEPHPLLSENLLAVKTGVDLLAEEESLANEQEREFYLDPNDLASSIGTLAISDKGDTRFVGRSGAEALLLERRMTRVPWMPEELDESGDGFPFDSGKMSKEELFVYIRGQIPPFPRATTLAETYLENFAWFFRPVKRDQIFEELLPSIYAWARECETSDPKDAPMVDTHQVALLFALFACGALADLTIAPDNEEAPVYNRIAKAALSRENLFGVANLQTIQALSLLGAYDLYLCSKNSLEFSWKMMSFSMILGSSIGIHRDPERWKLDPKIVDRRRNVFWELYHIDKWKSLGSGRPSIFRLEDVDCKHPEDNEPTILKNGDTTIGYHRWRNIFAKEVLGPLSEAFGAVRPLKYPEVLEFDRKIREYVYINEEELNEGTNPSRYVWMFYRDILLLFLHRNYFARAMIEYPDSPLKSPYAPSFLAGYATSITFLRKLREVYCLKPGLMLRFWTCWAHALAAAVMIGTIASRSNSETFAPTAFEELNLAINLFERSASHYVVRTGLPILLRLRDKALQQRESKSTPDRTDVSSKPAKLGFSMTSTSSVKEEVPTTDELSILRGTARVIQTQSSKMPSNRSSPLTDASSISGGSSSRQGSGSPPAPRFQPATTNANNFSVDNFGSMSSRAQISTSTSIFSTATPMTAQTQSFGGIGSSVMPSSNFEETSRQSMPRGLDDLVHNNQWNSSIPNSNNNLPASGGAVPQAWSGPNTYPTQSSEPTNFGLQTNAPGQTQSSFNQASSGTNPSNGLESSLWEQFLLSNGGPPPLLAGSANVFNEAWGSAFFGSPNMSANDAPGYNTNTVIMEDQSIPADASFFEALSSLNELPDFSKLGVDFHEMFPMSDSS